MATNANPDTNLTPHHCEVGEDPVAWIEVQDIVERCMGNLELAERILVRFRGSLGDSLQKLQLLAEQKDWQKLSKKAHRLKGEAGNVGCRPLEELASRVEAACEADQIEQACASLAELTQACGEFQNLNICLSDLT